MSGIVINSPKSILNFILLGLTLSSLGCSTSLDINKKYSESELNLQSCLESYNKNNIENVLKICSNVIKKFPDNPKPLNDRSLIYILNDNNILACEDIKKALDLITKGTDNRNHLNNYQMKVRHTYCTQ